jgi:hypothetical protein
VLATGFFDAPVDDRQLVRMVPPAPPGRLSQALVGYIWAINLRRGTGFAAHRKEMGRCSAKQTTQPLDRSKAVYVAYAGKKGEAVAGRYQLEAAIVREGETIVVRSMPSCTLK